MSTKLFKMPDGGIIGSVTREGQIQLNEAFFGYFGGIQDVSGRVAAYVDPSTATVADLINAMIASGQMKAE